MNENTRFLIQTIFMFLLAGLGVWLAVKGSQMATKTAPVKVPKKIIPAPSSSDTIGALSVEEESQHGELALVEEEQEE